MLASLRGDDFVVPFQVESMPVRGRLARLGAVAEHVLSRHAYPPVVSRVLGEALALTSMLGSALKFEGVFTLQAQGDGPISLLVVDYETPQGEAESGRVRGYASFDARAIGALGEGMLTIEELFGKGALALTVDPRLGRDRYQGIVPLEGEDLATCARHYFAQSEQIPTHVELAVAQHFTRGAAAPVWRASGLMVQYVPREGGAVDLSSEPGADFDNDDWRRAALLADTVGTDELVDPNLSPDRLLFRLFHEEGVRVFAPQPVMFGCRCSREKLAGVLRAYSPEEIAELAQDGVIEARCEFCSTPYAFTPSEFGGDA